MAMSRLMTRTPRRARIALSVAALGLLTWGLTLGGMQIPAVARWLIHVQLLPAAASFALIIFVAWVAVTLVFGRVYCSSVCPLGTLMDILGYAGRIPHTDGLPRNPRRRYRYARPRTPLRYIILTITLTCLIGGFMAIPAIIDPYTVYERFCLSLLHPAWCAITGADPTIPPEAEIIENAYPPLMISMSSMAGALISLASIMVIALVSIISGRTICNTICPVGTTLGMVSRYSIFQMDIDTDLCINCRRCEDACKGNCIDLQDHTVDSSRCVVCFDCTAVCPNKAIRYTASRKQLSIPMMQRIGRQGSLTGQSTAITKIVKTKN